jgi:hypothetical protein
MNAVHNFMRRRFVLFSVVLSAWLITAPCVAANEAPSKAAAAETLFQEARKLMDAKRYGDACPKLLESHKLDPALGTLLNLADCYERNNQFASAWQRFREAIVLAQKLGRANREQTARERAERVEPRVSRLTILSRSSGVELSLDGAPFDMSMLGTAIPIDPGKHTVEARAKGKKPFLKTIDVYEKERSLTVEIPVLEAEAIDPPKPKPEGHAISPTEEVNAEPKVETPKWSRKRTFGAIGIGVGLVGLGVGGYFAYRASSTWQEAQAYCDGNDCDTRGIDLAAQATWAGNIATATLIASGAIAIGGGVLFYLGRTPPSDPQKPTTRVSIGPGSLYLAGTF